MNPAARIPTPRRWERLPHAIAVEDVLRLVEVPDGKGPLPVRNRALLELGYATGLRSVTQGKAEFSMEFSRYAPAPAAIADELKKKYQEKRAAEHK